MALTKVGKEGITGIDNSSDATAITISSDEHVLIGTTTDGTTANGTVIRDAGEVLITRTDNPPLLLNRANSTGVVAEIRQANTAVGYISANSGGMGVYLGGTGSANHLDDYEEGTWTPVITVESQSAASITVDVAEYTKVGRLVSIVFQVTIDSISGGTDARAIELTGMPFNINSNAGGGPNIGYSTINSMTGTLSLQGRSSTLYRIVNLNGTTSLNASDHLKANSILRGQFTYHST